MTDAELLRAMAQWYRDGREFTPLVGDGESCGCFSTAKAACGGSQRMLYRTPLHQVLGHGDKFYGTDFLREAGWTGPKCTNDAIAACEIAADLAS